MKNIKLGYQFQNSRLLETAFTHPSYRNETGGEFDNQRLEFLGDAVIGCAAAHILHDMFPDADEGELSKKKNAVVSGENLAGYARGLSFGRCLFLGKGEEKTGGRERNSTLADVFEAVVGAIFLDGGYEKAFGFVSALVFQNCDKWRQTSDHKSKLQEFLQKNCSSLPVYETEETGPEHQRYFFCEVGDGSKIFGRGQGRNKKEAEQRAAKEALETLETRK